jgi:hypothetical protein
LLQISDNSSRVLAILDGGDWDGSTASIRNTVVSSQFNFTRASLSFTVRCFSNVLVWGVIGC